MGCLDIVSNLNNYYFLKDYNYTNFFTFKSSNYSVGFSDFNKKFVYSSILNDIFYLSGNLNKINYFTFLCEKFKIIGLACLSYFYNLF